MTSIPSPSPRTYDAMHARAEKAEQLAAERLDALQAIREALDIPYAATVGDDEIRTPIALARVMDAVILLRSLTDPGRLQADWYVPHSIAYLREMLGAHPATGYRTWDQVRAEQARTCRCGQPKPEGNDLCPACEKAEGAAALAALRSLAADTEVQP